VLWVDEVIEHKFEGLFLPKNDSDFLGGTILQEANIPFAAFLPLIRFGEAIQNTALFVDGIFVLFAIVDFDLFQRYDRFVSGGVLLFDVDGALPFAVLCFGFFVVRHLLRRSMEVQ